MGSIFHKGTRYAGLGSLWGLIKGNITDQTDLKNALDAKYDKSLANELGAKNLFPLSNFSVVGTGVTWTINNDGTVTANGTAGGSTDARLDIIIPTDILFGDFYMSGCPSGGGASNYDVYCWDTTAGARARKWDGTTTSESDYGGTSAQIQLIKGHNTRVGLRVMNGATVNNIVFKPMIRLSTDADDTFYPAAQSNRGLTLGKCDNSVIAPVESGTTASKAYAIGEHFIKDGAFCTAKTAIASGATFTLNTNYTAGSIADAVVQSNWSYTTSGLTATNCTIVGGGYCKIGNLAIVNMRIKFTSTSGITITGFPSYGGKTGNTNPLEFISYLVGAADIMQYLLGHTGTMMAYKGTGSTSIQDKEGRFSFMYLCD